MTVPAATSVSGEVLESWSCRKIVTTTVKAALDVSIIGANCLGSVTRFEGPVSRYAPGSPKPFVLRVALESGSGGTSS